MKDGLVSEVISWRIMETYGIALLYGGLALAALGWVWLIMRAFQEKVWWGLASLLVPPVALVSRSYAMHKKRSLRWSHSF